MSTSHAECPRCGRPTRRRPDYRPALCPACRKARRSERRAGSPVAVPWFWLYAGGLVLADAVLTLLGRLWPLPGVILLAFGLVQAVVGLRVLYRGWLGGQHLGDVDWTGARWPLFAIASGLVCVGCFFSFAFPHLPKPPPREIVGTWRASSGQTLEFCPDGRLVTKGPDGTTEQHYQFLNDETFDVTGADGGTPVRMRLEWQGRGEVILSGPRGQMSLEKTH